jgi:riboflavin biosynthesis pyrimidine reductase
MDPADAAVLAWEAARSSYLAGAGAGDGAPRLLPFVTLTFAQSLDGCIARDRGRPTAISCRDTFRLTHELRARHSALLVGVGTVCADDPSLTTRLATSPYAAARMEAGTAHPRPVVLDPTLRTPLTSKVVLDAARRGTVLLARAPSSGDSGEEAEAAGQRRLALVAKGCRVIDVPSTVALPGGGGGGGTGLDLRAAMRALRVELGVESVMVEGGASTLASFLAQQQQSGGDGAGPLVHHLLVTVAPLLLPGGLSVSSAASPVEGARPPPFRLVPSAPGASVWRVVGEDVVGQGAVATAAAAAGE